MKKVIELLQDLKLDIHNLYVDRYSVALKDEAIKLVSTIINELQAPPRWIPYGNLMDAVKLLREVAEEVEELPCNDQKKIRQAVAKTECAAGAIETLIPLPMPRWETPEQWEKRTGEPWPDDWAVYARQKEHGKWSGWIVARLNYARLGTEGIEHTIVCATEAGPPPNDWRPGET